MSYFPLPGGYAEELGWPPRRYDQRELSKGIEHELEHTDSFEVARQIAMDHLAEQVMQGRRQDYYTRLQSMTPNRSKPELYREWQDLINLTADELEAFLETPEGKIAGLSREEARRQGIGSGQDSAKWIIRMKRTAVDDWTWKMWDWAQRQVSFVKRMSGMKGPLFKDGKPTRKLLSLLVWGHAPKEVLRTLRDDQPKTRRPGKAFAANQALEDEELVPNRARHPFRSIDAEQQLTSRTSAAHPDYERRHRRRYVVAGIDRQGNDWSLGAFESLDEAAARARSQRVYPEAVVLDQHTGSVLVQS